MTDLHRRAMEPADPRDMNASRLAYLLALFLKTERPKLSKEEHESNRNQGLVLGSMDSQRFLTTKGHAYITMVLRTPLPIEKWVDPREGIG